MIPGVALQPQAARDAEEIFAYIAKDDAAAARRFNEAVADTLTALRKSPGLGIAWQARDGRLTGLRWKRVRGFKNYLIFYRPEPDRIVVVRILHGASDIENILG